MQCDICIYNKVEYIDNEQSYKNPTNEVILRLQEIFAMQSRTGQNFVSPVFQQNIF